MDNVERSMKVSDILVDHGFVPYNPLINHWWNERYPRGYEFWMEYTGVWLAKCDMLLRLPGESPGADREVARAIELDIPVFYELETLIESYEY